MERVLKFGMLSVLLAGLLFSSFVLAFADGAAITNVGGGSTGGDGADTDPAGTLGVNAGNVYHLDLDAESTTNYWAGVWGNVSGKVELRDSNGAIFFTESMLQPPKSAGGFHRSLVFAFIGGDAVPAFNSLNAAPRTGANIDSTTGVGTTLTDSATNLFDNAGFDTTVGNKTIDAGANQAWCARTYQGAGFGLITADCNFATMALNDGSSNMLFVTEAQDPYAGNDVRIFDNATYANYQMLLYVNNSGTGNAQNYEFFLELR